MNASSNDSAESAMGRWVIAGLVAWFAIAFVVPVAVFLGLDSASARFLVLLGVGLLPGFFAWPAGLGDVAIGLSAPFVALALLREPGFAAGRRFAVWNWLGILDFVVAVATGGLASGMVPGLVEVTTAPLTALPLALIPGFLVPLFTILHLAALMQARRAPAPAAAAA